jgi:hypothetical protein
MKCVQCGVELAAGAKFCPECGAKQELKCAACGASLAPGAKFCPECGAKTDAAKVGAGGTAVTRIEISPLATGLPECKVEITGVEAEGPDDDGDYRFAIKYNLTNDADEDWEYLESRTQILNAAGQIIEESRDSNEQTVSAGETAELEVSTWGIKGKLLGSNPEQTHIVLSVIASAFGREKLGEIAIPETPLETVALKPVKIGEAVQLISGSLWKTEPDDDKECRVEIKALVQNLTKLHLPEVKIVAEVMDKQGRELTDAGGQDELRPGNIVIINGSGYAKEKKFAGAMVVLAMQAYWPVALGTTQSQGCSVTAPEHDNCGDDDCESGDGESPLRAMMGSIKSSIEMGEQDTLVCVSCRVAELESEKVQFDISNLSAADRQRLSSLIDAELIGDEANGYSINTSKTSIMLSWLLPEADASLSASMKEAYSDWKISQEDSYSGNIQATSVDWSGDSRGIGSELKLMTADGRLLDLPDYLEGADHSYDDEGSIVLGYEVIDAQPWDVRIIWRDRDEYRVEIWDQDDDPSFPEWLARWRQG